MVDSGQAAQQTLAWSATGIGSLPGTDPAEAARMVVGELPDWPHLPELPGRGAGADMVGRTMSQLSEVSPEFAVQTAPAGWQRTARPGRDMRRAASFLAADLEAVDEHLAGYTGPFTIPLAGPWTLAGTVTDARGERSLRDPGYLHDLSQAHAVAAETLVRRLARTLPGAQLIVTVDEPLLAAVASGTLSFSSGYRRHAPVPHEQLAGGLTPTREAVRAAGARFAVHTCARPVWPVLQSVAPDVLSLDATLLQPDDLEPLGGWLESASGFVWGVWPTSGPARPDEGARAAGLIAGWLHRIGLSAANLSGRSAVSPRCGLAGASASQARAAMVGSREVARRLEDSAG